MTMMTMGLSQYAILSLTIGVHSLADVVFTLGMQGHHVGRAAAYEIYRWEREGVTLICTFDAEGVLASKVVKR